MALGSEIEEHTAGLVLTGELVRSIKRVRPKLGSCQVTFANNEVWVSGLAAQKVKALLTKAQIASVLAKAKLFGSKVVVKNVLVSGYALIKATVSVCKPNKRQLESMLRARLKRPPLFQTHVDGAGSAYVAQT
ncbi:hypothetical protein AAHH87_00735 [Candidatus Hodgkinia cicadicola]